MSKTINDLVNFMENAVAEKWWYVWGANGEVFTEELKQKLIKQFSNPDTSENPYNKNYYENLFKSHKGKHVADCSGLITAFVGIENDKTAQGFYNYCSIKGTRNNYNGSVGYLLFDQDGSTMVHVGVAVGNNMVIHSKGSSYGIVNSENYGILLEINNEVKELKKLFKEAFMKQLSFYFHFIITIFALLLLCSCDNKETASIPATLTPNPPTASPVIMSPDSSPDLSVTPSIDSDLKYTSFTLLSNGITKERLEELYLKYLCKEWYDFNMVSHIITRDGIDQKKIQILWGHEVEGISVDFAFNFIENPMERPLYLCFFIEEETISLQTHFENEHDWERNEFYTDVNWCSKENLPEVLMKQNLWNVHPYTNYYNQQLEHALLIPELKTEQLQELFTVNLAGNWYDTKQNPHTISGFQIDGREIELFRGIQYTESCFGFGFNFITTPMKYPLFVLVDTKKDWLSFRTFFETERDWEEPSTSKYYTNMFWSRKESSEDLMEYLNTDDTYFEIYEAADYYLDFILSVKSVE